MTNSNGSSIEQRLTEIENQITFIRAQMETNGRYILSLPTVSSQLLAIASLHQQALRVAQLNAEAHRAQMREMQAEIRGIQTENQQILNYLFGQQNLTFSPSKTHA